MNYLDVVMGLAWGDESKSKVVNSLLKDKDYTHTFRFSGGANCGHTVYQDGKKIVLHCIPTGVIQGIRSVIGDGCALNVKTFFDELDQLKSFGIKNLYNNIKISKNCHIVTDKHIEEDSKDERIGTTKRGIGPCYRDKHDRKGIRAKEISELKQFIIDPYEEFYSGKTNKVLFEGAQGNNLSIESDDYPYVTSTYTTIGSIFTNGFSPRDLRDVWGVAKIYDTYVGNKCFQPKDIVFEEIQKVGEEFGATTGRKRQCNWLDFDRLMKSIQLNAVNKLVINKMDVLRKIDQWKLIYKEQIISFKNEENIKDWIEEKLKLGIYWSDKKEEI